MLLLAAQRIKPIHLIVFACAGNFPVNLTSPRATLQTANYRLRAARARKYTRTCPPRMSHKTPGPRRFIIALLFSPLLAVRAERRDALFRRGTETMWCGTTGVSRRSRLGRPRRYAPSVETTSTRFPERVLRRAALDTSPLLSRSYHRATVGRDYLTLKSHLPSLSLSLRPSLFPFASSFSPFSFFGFFSFYRNTTRDSARRLHGERESNKASRCAFSVMRNVNRARARAWTLGLP